MKILKDAPIDDELMKLLEQDKGHKMTPSERRKQRISFAFGNLPHSNKTTTHEDVERLAKEMAL